MYSATCTSPMELKAANCKTTRTEPRGQPCVSIVYTAVSKKVVIVNSRRILEPKGTLGRAIISDNALAKVATLWPWHYDEPALYILQIQC